MADKPYDPWHFTEGLAESYHGKIVDSYFTFDSNYQDGSELLLKLEIQTDDLELGEGGKVIEQYPIKEHEPKEKGKKAAHISGKPKNLNKNSGVALLCAAAVEAGAGETLHERGTPLDADIWQGLEFDWKRAQYEGTFGGEKRTWSRMLPEKFYANGNSAGSGNGTAAAATATTATGDGDVTRVSNTGNQGSSGEGSGGVSPVLKAKLLNLAKQHTDHGSFMEAAFGVDGVMNNAEAEAAVADDGAGSIWASSRG